MLINLIKGIEMASENNRRKNNTQRIMRALHRDVGFFIIGLIVIYSISGIVLTYRNTQLFKSEYRVEKNLEPGMETTELGEALHMRRFRVESESDNFVYFESGTYNKETGLASYSSYELPSILDRFIRLHKTESGSIRSYFTVALGISLGFMAISSLWLYKPGTNRSKRGFILTAVGVVVSVLLLWI